MERADPIDDEEYRRLDDQGAIDDLNCYQDANGRPTTQCLEIKSGNLGRLRGKLVIIDYGEPSD
jgi:hypothetical protein